MNVYKTALDMIGNTPMVKVNHLDTGVCELYLKLEYANPGGSIKDRIGLSMIEAAEQQGLIHSGDTLVEATAGNTGLGLALVARQKGYNLIIVMPDKMSQEKVFNLRALGAEVIMTRSDVGKGHPEYYQDVAARIADEQQAYFVNQFGNEANAKAHEEHTGPEIWQQMDHKVDAIVCGIGSGGTASGIGRFFKSVSPHTKMVLADPKGSILAELVNHGRNVEPGSWLVEGIGEDFVPSICDLDLVAEAITIDDQTSFNTAREVLNKESLMVGSSSGTLIAAALAYCRAQTTAQRVVTFACDTGNKYISKMYNDYWMLEHGFIEAPLYHDLRDLVSRPMQNKSTIIARPTDKVSFVFMQLKDNNLSQLPVIDEGKLIGAIDEEQILHTVSEDIKKFSATVGDVMDPYPPIVDKDASIRQLTIKLKRQNSVYVVDNDVFLGVISRIDLINYLARVHKAQ